MMVFALGFGSEACAGLAMFSMVRAGDRINLYPAAPIRLATMVRTWTITTRGMGLIFWTASSPNGPAVTHPTRQPAFRSGNEARWNA